MKDLVREAIQVAEELGDITSVGALAVYLHIKKTRESQDLDFALASGVSREEAIKKGRYTTFTENRKDITRTPRGVKVDIYNTDVSGILTERIAETAIDVQVSRKIEKRSKVFKIGKVKELASTR